MAQCALLIAYEWMVKSGISSNDKAILEQSNMVDIIKVERLSQYFEDALEKADFFYPEDKAESMKINFRNMWSRMPLTNSDVQIFYGMLRQLLRKNKKS